MDIDKNTQTSIDEIQADRRLVEELSGHGLITQTAREHALQLLYPLKNWGLWISRFQLVAGIGLVLAGIIYFFAFNWAKIGSSIKLASVEICILGCLAINAMPYQRHHCRPIPTIGMPQCRMITKHRQ